MVIDRQQLLKEIGVTKKEKKLKVKDWLKISQKKNLSEDFIRTFNVYLCWRSICSFQKLSETILEEFKDEVYWMTISKYQKLSEEFIREFEAKVYWPDISSSYNLSLSFLIEFKNKIDWNLYFYHQCNDFQILKKFISKTDYANINELPHLILNENQKMELNKILALKYTFINKTINQID
jgi:hypothetical protein